MVDLAAIGAKNSRYGSEYSTFTANDTVTFGTNDVYVYDKDGNVYYARGGGSLDNDTPIYQVDGKTEFGGLVIESVITTSELRHELSLNVAGMSPLTSFKVGHIVIV